MTSPQHVSGSTLKSRGYRFLFHSAGGSDVYGKLSGETADSRLYVDGLGNVRDSDGNYLDNFFFGRQNPEPVD